MDFTFEITNHDKLTRFFDVIKTMDFEQLREAIKKVEQDMTFLSVTNKRIIEMNNDDIMWDSENKRIKIKTHRSEEENDQLKSYCANLGAFNRLIINNCGLETNYREYEEFKDMIIEYIRKEVSEGRPSVMTLIDGLVETLRKKYGVKFQNFEQIEEYRKMHALLLVGNDTKRQSHAITHENTYIDER